MRKLFLILLLMPLLAAQQSVGREGLKWVFSTDDYVISSPAVHNGVVFFGSADGYFYALNSTNGTPLWTYGRVGRIQTSPAVSDEMVFFGSNDGYLYALLLNGTLAWKFQTDDIILSSPALSSGMVFFGSNDGYLYALLLNGTLAWKFQTGNKIISSPAYDYGLLYFGSTDGTLYAFDPYAGRMLWNYTGEAAFASSPITSNWIVYAGSDDGTLYAFNAFNGTVVWKQKYPGKIQSNFAISPSNILYFSCKDGNIYAVYAADGSKSWNITTGTEAQSSVHYDADSGFSYFGTSDNNLYAADPQGHIAWRFETGNWVISTPLDYRGILYVGSYDGNLYAISTIRTSFAYSEMNVTGPFASINGTSYADTGVKYVQVRFNEGEWENASGTTSWSYTWNASSFKNGGYTFEARSIDNLSNAELPPYSSSLVRLQSVVRKEMIVSYTATAVVGLPIKFEVNDSDGNPVPYPEVTIFGKIYLGDKNGVVAADEKGNPIKSDAEGQFNFTVSKQGYITQERTLKVEKLVDALPYILASIAVPLAILLPLAYLLIRKLSSRRKQ
ncbi:PQQ-binding-like beta-propeller repeat protein [Candidatus Micrarchaeota archaeon]|nr:PQQ-binding-like beta-propeller repeat protein [Candidatus Micrarchaeota archaeon]